MKTFTQYLAEAVKEIPIRIKLATDLTDEMIETIESELARYDVVNVAKPVKTIVQEHPLDFGTKIRNAEVVIIDATVRMPISAETFRRNLSDKLAIPYDYVVVKGANDPLEAENEAEVIRQGATGEDYEPKMGQDYTEEEQGEDGKKFAGEEFKADFLKTLSDNKDKNPDRAQIEVEGPLSVKSPKAEKDTSQPKEDDKKAVSPYQTKNTIAFPNHPKKG
jgi:hypothetical protein